MSRQWSVMSIARIRGFMRIKLLCSDLDGTLLGYDGAARRFKQAWEALPPESRPLLCYSSGRLLDDIFELLKTETLPRPDYIIGGIGTQFYDAKLGQAIGLAGEFRDGWDLARVEKIMMNVPGVTHQPPQFLHSRKSSWYLHNASVETVNALRKQLADSGLDVSVIYSSDLYLDVLPSSAGKGRSLQRLCEFIGVPLNSVVVAGDGGNDVEMFLLPEVNRILIANARQELCDAVAHLPAYAAANAFADGVLEGLEFFLNPSSLLSPRCPST